MVNTAAGIVDSPRRMHEPGVSTLSENHIMSDNIEIGHVAPGTRVEVRSRFDDQWSAGFEVIDTTDQGVRLRRLSDGAELPILFDVDDVRRERRRKRGMWWY